MFECILAWYFLFAGLFAGDSTYFVASGVFAIAAQIYACREERNKK